MSAIGTQRTLRNARVTSAYGCGADIDGRTFDVERTLTRSAPSVPPPGASSEIRALLSEFQRPRAIGTGINSERDPATWLH